MGLIESQYSENLGKIRSELIKQSSLVVRQRFGEDRAQAPYSITIQLANGASRTLYPVLDLNKLAKQISIRSDQDITVQINDNRDYPAEAQNKTITIYANSPVSFDTNLWKLTLTNNSGATANIRVYASSEVQKVEGI